MDQGYIWRHFQTDNYQGGYSENHREIVWTCAKWH